MGFELHDPSALIRSFREMESERNWLEFKENTFKAETVGKYVSGLANAAMLEREKCAFMVWGIKDGTHELVGTSVRLATEKVGAERSYFGSIRRCGRSSTFNTNPSSLRESILNC